MASRQCTVEIDNASQSYHLTNPKMYLEHGRCSKRLPIDINPGTKGGALFIKTPYSLTGSVGVFTYELFNMRSETTVEIAVMFSVPYNYWFYSNWFAVGVYNRSKSCDYDLYNEMYYKSQPGFVRGKAKDGVLHYQHKDVVIHATMSDTYTPYLWVQVEQK